jgi:hypothetical protein
MWTSVNSPVTEEHTVIEIPTAEPRVNSALQHNEHRAIISDRWWASGTPRPFFWSFLPLGCWGLKFMGSWIRLYMTMAGIEEPLVEFEVIIIN